MSEITSISGEISLLYHDTHAYKGPVVLLSIDPDETLALNTFEITGRLAERLQADDLLEEGMRVRVDCRADTVEVVSLDTGETSDKTAAVVVDVVILEA